MMETALIAALQIFSLLLLYESIQRKKIPLVLFSATVMILNQFALFPLQKITGSMISAFFWEACC